MTNGATAPSTPEGWYADEFEEYLDEIGFPAYTKDGYTQLCNLEKYLLKHHFIERTLYWNRYNYRINKGKLF